MQKPLYAGTGRLVNGEACLSEGSALAVGYFDLLLELLFSVKTSPVRPGQDTSDIFLTDCASVPSVGLG